VYQVVCDVGNPTNEYIDVYQYMSVCHSYTLCSNNYWNIVFETKELFDYVCLCILFDSEIVILCCLCGSYTFLFDHMFLLTK